jgi:hypothetical protein
MGVAYTTLAIEAEFAGVGGGWTNITGDIRNANQQITVSYGIRGGGPTALVADQGILTMAMNNVAGGVLGYYAPSHASHRSGFGLGIRVRLSVVSGGVTYYKFFGTIDSIRPEPGKLNRISTVRAVDWMDEAARYQIQGIPASVGVRADQVLTTILAAMPKQPNATSFGVGSDTYRYAPAMGGTEKFTFLSEAQRLMMSELGLLVIRGGTAAAAAGTLAFISRGQLVTSPYNVSQVTLTDTMISLPAEMSREAVLNVFRTVTHPNRVDPLSSSAVVLFSMPEPLQITGGAAAITILGQYSDPAQQAQRVSGYAMIGSAGQPAMVNGFDYYFTANPDGTGADLSGSLTFTPSPGSEGVRYVVSSSVSGYFWAQARGYGLYDYDATVTEKRDTASVTAYGESPVDLDLHYQHDPTFGQNVGLYLLAFWKDPNTLVESVGFFANDSSTNMLHALAREPGDRITVAETSTGVNKAYRIQSVDLLFKDKLLWCTWGLSPMADTTDYWVLEEGGSALGTNTVIAL